MARHPQADKLGLTTRLPRTPGVYLFRDRTGRVLYVGKASNLRARVRSYFSTDDRRKIGALLRDTARIDHKRCGSTLEAAVLEARLIRTLLPTYNSAGTRWQRAPYLKLTLDEAYPRLSVVRSVRDDGAVYLGPLPSQAMAKRVVEAIESVVPLRRCTQPVGRTPSREAPCTAAQLGVALCPCAGGVDPAAYRRDVDRVVAGLTVPARPPDRAAPGPHGAPRPGRALRGGGPRPRPAGRTHHRPPTPTTVPPAARLRAPRHHGRVRRTGGAATGRPVAHVAAPTVDEVRTSRWRCGHPTTTRPAGSRCSPTHRRTRSQPVDA